MLKSSKGSMQIDKETQTKNAKKKATDQMKRLGQKTIVYMRIQIAEWRKRSNSRRRKGGGGLGKARRGASRSPSPHSTLSQPQTRQPPPTAASLLGREEKEGCPAAPLHSVEKEREAEKGTVFSISLLRYSDPQRATTSRHTDKIFMGNSFQDPNANVFSITQLRHPVRLNESLWWNSKKDITFSLRFFFFFNSFDFEFFV